MKGMESERIDVSGTGDDRPNYIAIEFHIHVCLHSVVMYLGRNTITDIVLNTIV